jgi:hypothetical protein
VSAPSAHSLELRHLDERAREDRAQVAKIDERLDRIEIVVGKLDGAFRWWMVVTAGLFVTVAGAAVAAAVKVLAK